MRKLVYIVLAISFIACGKPQWNREALAEKCKKNMAKDPKMKDQLTAAQQVQVCDCSAEKVMAKYKTKSEADNDLPGVEAIGTECATAILMPPEPVDTNVSTDTTTVPDSTGNQ